MRSLTVTSNAIISLILAELLLVQELVAVGRDPI